MKSIGDKILISNSQAVLIFIMSLFYHNMAGQSPNNGTEKSLTNLNFNCSYINCNYTLKGTFLNDIETLRNDDGEMFSGFDFNIQSSYYPEPGNPIAYVSGSTIKLNLKLYVSNCEGAFPSNARIRGVSSTDYQFPQLQLIEKTENGLTWYEYESEASSSLVNFVQKPLPVEVVDMFNLDVQWEISVETDQWEKIAVTMNRIYVTWKEPKPELDQYKHFETTFYLGCNFAKYATSAENIIGEVWEKGFKNSNVTNNEELPLHYYYYWTTPYNTPGQLLINRDGICFSWARLFLDVFKIQGIAYQGNELSITSTLDVADGFLVRKWNWLGNSNMLQNHPSQGVQNILGQGFTYLATAKNEDEAFNYGNNTYKFLYKEIEDEMGKKGQNTDNPLAIFFLHVIAEINQKVYDASYGGHLPIDFNNGDFISDYENENIFGYYRFAPVSQVDETIVNQDLNGDGSITTDAFVYFFFIKMHKNTENDLKFISSPY